MLLLGIETATRRVGVVIASEDGILGRIELGGHAGSGAPRHAECLVPAIQYLCEQTGTMLDRVSAIAVGVGPGMFTGLRVGVTTAKVLAQTLRVPMIPIPSLDLLAYPLRHAHGLVVPAIDARRHELYYALYRTVPGGVQRDSNYEIGEPDDLVAELEARGEEALLCGDGALRFASAFAEVKRTELAGPGHAAPGLAALAELAIARYAREEFCAPDDVLPLYLRKSDAELAWDRKGR
jgi:tRNA threonylcarbamoyladenosine biosynthesis protein TsaB